MQFLSLWKNLEWKSFLVATRKKNLLQAKVILGSWENEQPAFVAEQRKFPAQKRRELVVCSRTRLFTSFLIFEFIKLHTWNIYSTSDDLMPKQNASKNAQNVSSHKERDDIETCRELSGEDREILFLLSRNAFEWRSSKKTFSSETNTKLLLVSSSWHWKLSSLLAVVFDVS